MSGSTYDGINSYLEVQVNTTLFAIGESGSFEFKTRAELARMMLIQWHQAGTLIPSVSLEMLVFDRKFQAVSKFGEGNF